MSQGKVFVKVGTTMAKVHPDRRTLVKHQLEQASKIPSVKTARAKALKGGVPRKFPKFEEGMTVATYVRQFTMLNARQSGYAIHSGSFLSWMDVQREEQWMTNFYAPLSTLPQFSQTGEVIEEVLA